MTDAKSVKVPIGLPNFLNEGDNGFTALCELLHITLTSQKLKLVKVGFVRKFLQTRGKSAGDLKGKKTAQRLREQIVEVYSHPQLRQDMWQELYKDLAKPEPERLKWPPSLEFESLKWYDDALWQSEPDDERLVECADLYSSANSKDEWRKPALAVLPSVLADFRNWEKLANDRKQAVIVAGFVVSTLLDDIRILQWASNLHDDIANEYSFLKQEAPKSTETNTERDIASEQVKKRAEALRDLADDLAKEPISSRLFRAINDAYQSLSELREVVEQLDGSEAIARILNELEAIIDKAAESTQWIEDEDKERILTEWKAAYPMADQTDPESMSRDLARFKAVLKDGLSGITKLTKAHQIAETKYDEYKASIGDVPSLKDRRNLNNLEKSKNERNGELLDTVEDVLQSLQPAVNVDSPPQVETREGDDVPIEDEAGHSTSSEQNDEDEQQSTPMQSTPDGKEGEATGKETDSSEPTELKDKSDTGASQETEPNSSTEQDKTTTVLDTPTSSASTETSLTPVQSAIWSAIEKGKFGLAFHISSQYSNQSNQAHQPSPALLAALALGQSFCSPNDDLCIEFDKHAQVLLGDHDFDAVEPDTRDALNLLLFTAALRPAIFGTQRGYVPLLSGIRLSAQLVPVYKLAKAIADQATKLQGITLEAVGLQSILNQRSWANRFEKFSADFLDMYASALKYSFKHVGPHNLWQKWLSRGQLLDDIKTKLTVDDLSNQMNIKSIADMLTDHRSLSDLIDREYKKLNPGKQITGTPKIQLEKHLQTYGKWAQDWLEITQSKPGSADFIEQIIEQLSLAVEKNAQDALDTIETEQMSAVSKPLSIALGCARCNVERLVAVFQPENDLEVYPRRNPTQLLADDLLLVTDIGVNERGEIVDPLKNGDVFKLLIDFQSHETDLVSAFDTRLEKHDLLGARALHQIMEQEEVEGHEAKYDDLEDAISRVRKHIQPDLYKLAEQNDQLYAMGEIRSNIFNEILSNIQEAREVPMDNVDDIIFVKERIKELMEKINPQLRQVIENFELEFEKYQKLSEHEKGLLQASIEESDLPTLQEHLSCLENQQPLVSARNKDISHLTHFLAVIDRFEKEYDSGSKPIQSDFIEAARCRENIVQLDFSDLSHDQSIRSTELIEVWFEMARDHHVDTERLGKLFNLLGFSLRGKGVLVSEGNSVVLHSEPLRTRELCPSYYFGSAARGNYRVILNFKGFGWDSFVQAVTSRLTNTPTIVLYFGRLSRDERERLKEWSNEHSSKFITIDDTLVLYLASLASDKLRPLFDCSLPFTKDEPYFTAAGQIPPESFFGREKERNDVLAQYEAAL